ncbi:MAG TPA: autotransporter-associated beta strand repeat-containing protein [Rariglobus sp.]|nr:autotransporter-associated beta strand repeat-containing protein [Rariglobus sp.]
MKTHCFPALDRSLLVTALLFTGFATTAKSAVNSWTGTTGNWSDNTWSDGSPPDAQDASAAITVAGAMVDLGGTSRTVGSLQIGNATTVTLSSSSGGSLIFNSSVGNATLTMATVNGSNTISAPVTLTSSLDVTVGATTSTRILILSGKTSGSGAITIKNSVGKLQLNNSANDFSGGVTIESGGTLSVVAGGSYLGTGSLTLNTGAGIQTAAAGTVNVGSQIWAGNFTTSTTSGSLNLGTSAVNLNGGTRTVTLSTNTSNRNTTVGGVISNGGLAISNTGTANSSLILTGANTYAGGSTVNSGTLATSTTGTFGTGGVTVATGAFLTAGNAASFADQASLTFSSTSTASSINLSFTGSDTIGAVYDSISATYLAAGTYTSSQLNTFFSSSVFAGTGSLTISAVPEPSTYAVIFGALALGATVIRRRRG